MRHSKRICLAPRMRGVGGMVSFQHKLTEGLQHRGYEVGFDPADGAYTSVLIIGGTRQVAGVWRARRRGARIVQRLDGMNWLHKVRGRTRPALSLRHVLRAEYGNWLLAWTRKRLAHRIVYQSEFSKQWWERVYGPANKPHRIIYNAVDLDRYTPQGDHTRPGDRWRILLVEGSLMGGYEMGLQAAVELGFYLSQILVDHPKLNRPIELMVAGKVSREVQDTWDQKFNENWAARSNGRFSLTWAGLVPGESISELDRSAHLLYSADINAACPNSVIEALACGLPVVAFDTGALPELVSQEAGRVVSYGGDPWKLDSPDTSALARAACDLLGNLDDHRQAARLRAEVEFSLEDMVDGYLEVLLDAK
jgi:glycosyltransferase involved in cell wall biosynthesis